MRTVKNPWYESHNRYSKPAFVYTGNCLFQYRGVEVFKNPAGSWDYVLGDTTITQRAGFSELIAESVIDDILDGKTPVSDRVYTHLKILGHSPMSYDDCR